MIHPKRCSRLAILTGVLAGAVINGCGEGTVTDPPLLRGVGARVEIDNRFAFTMNPRFVAIKKGESIDFAFQVRAGHTCVLSFDGRFAPSAIGNITTSRTVGIKFDFPKPPFSGPVLYQSRVECRNIYGSGDWLGGDISVRQQ